jgi:hypothetical protein
MTTSSAARRSTARGARDANQRRKNVLRAGPRLGQAWTDLDDRPDDHAPHAAHSATILCDGSAKLPVSYRAARAEAVHRAAGRTGGQAEQCAQQTGIPALAERALPTVLHGMRRLSFGAHPGGGFRPAPQPETRHQAQCEPRALGPLGLGHRGAVCAVPPLFYKGRIVTIPGNSHKISPSPAPGSARRAAPRDRCGPRSSPMAAPRRADRTARSRRAASGTRSAGSPRS